MSSRQQYSRREFLGTGARSVLGFAALVTTPGILRTLCISDQSYLERSFVTMGTTATVSAWGESRSHLISATSKVFAELQRLDKMLSLYEPSSQVSRVNQAAGQDPVRVSNEVLDILSAARTFNELTGGSFDVTIEPLMTLWGFRREDHRLRRLPSDAELRDTLDAVGMHQIQVDSSLQTVGLWQSRSKMDLGGIAVGYSVDRVVSILKAEGITAALVNHSGDAYAVGSPPESEGWEVSIPNPLYPYEMMIDLCLTDMAISTSGSYEKYVTVGEERFGHILLPNSGRPSAFSLSTTVIAPSALEADALSTGLFCLPMTRRTSIVKSQPGIRCISVEATPDGKPSVTWIG